MDLRQRKTFIGSFRAKPGSRHIAPDFSGESLLVMEDFLNGITQQCLFAVIAIGDLTADFANRNPYLAFIIGFAGIRSFIP